MPATPPSPARLIGRRRDLEGLAEYPGLQACHGPAWTLQANLSFLEDLVRGPVALASPPPPEGSSRSFFAWEWGWLGLHGRVDAPPGWGAWARAGDPLLDALATDARGFLDRVTHRARAGEVRMPDFGPVVARMAWVATQVEDGLAQEGRALLRLGTPYAPTLRYALEFATRLDALARASEPGLPVEFEPKVRGELEGLIAAFPHAIAFPTFGPLTRRDLIRLRASPVHPLGLALAPRVVDGARRSPLEFFLHDLDHARYKVREDLGLRGIKVRDPYQVAPGATQATTLEDPDSGRHRTVLDQVDPRTLARLPARPPALDPRRLFAVLASWPGDLRSTAEALLFELLHEKSLPADAGRLARECTLASHHAKLGAKVSAGFIAELPFPLARLEAAGHALARVLPALAP